MRIEWVSGTAGADAAAAAASVRLLCLAVDLAES